jgi:hypothetical protein
MVLEPFVVGRAHRVDAPEVEGPDRGQRDGDRMMHVLDEPGDLAQPVRRAEPEGRRVRAGKPGACSEPGPYTGQLDLHLPESTYLAGGRPGGAFSRWRATIRSEGKNEQ